MRVHHLNCGSFCPHGARLVEGRGGLLTKAHIVCHCLAIEGEDGVVLVDTGFGTDDARDPKQLGQPFRALMAPRPALEETALHRLRALGFEAGDVKQIVTTHLDLDHTGGLPDFPEAEVHVFASELEAAFNPKLNERARYVATHWKHGPHWVEHRAEAGGESWFGFESVRILPGFDTDVLLVPMAGHSRGHTGVAVRDGDGWLLHCGDAYLNHGQVETPPSCPPVIGFYQRILAADNGARTANTERLRELAARHGDEVTLFCSHDPRELEREQDRAAAGTAAA
jgi:glyoxylase-like metal-dependent hydrolase (beta-lactamase superfamily II)